jgi:hypothetical protein
LNRALLLMVAFKQNDLIKFVLTEKAILMVTETLKKAFESASATNNLVAFQSIYHEALGQPDTLHFLPPMLENALYWAVIMRNEGIICMILERAFADGNVANLSLSRAGHYARTALKQGVLSDDDKAILTSILERLLDAARLQQTAGISPQTPLDVATQHLFNLIPSLPPELGALIISFVLRHTTK